MKKNKYTLIVIIFLSVAQHSHAQTITSLSRITAPTLPNAGLIVNGGFETGAPLPDTWYQWAKTGCNPIPDQIPTGWTVTSEPSNSFGGNPIRYATWGTLVQGTAPGGLYPFIFPSQSGLYEVYSTSSTECTNTNGTATASDPGSFPLGVASADGGNYLYFGNGVGSITGFPSPNAAWVSSTTSPDNLRVYDDNSSLGVLTGPAPVTLEQLVTTTVGANYVLQFWVSGEELNVGTQGDGFFQLQIGTQNLYLAIPGSANDHSLGNQFYYQVIFTAASANTVIKFINYCHPFEASWDGYLAGTAGSELILDDVRMDLFSVLPTHLILFKADKNDNKINLSWKVEDQINFGHYEVERSFNLSEPFTSISTVNTNNNSTGVYNFTDDISNDQRHEVAYYRLKMVDKNGSFTFSQVVKVNLNNHHLVEIYPNILRPGEIITIKRRNITDRAEIQVTNMNGQVIRKSRFNGANFIKMQTGGWAAGTYILTVTDSQIRNNYKVIIK